MEVGLFLDDPQRARSVSSSDPHIVGVDRAVAEFDALSRVEGNFLGVVRDDGELLQFVWNGDGTLDVNAPRPAWNGSFTRRASFAECRGLIESFAAGLAVEAIPGIRFDGWPST